MTTHIDQEHASQSMANKPGAAVFWLVVISHHEARIFRSDEPGAISEHIRPEQTDDSISHAHTFDGFSRGQEKPVPSSYFGPVSDVLRDANQILIFGCGTGTGSEMGQFLAWLHVHHPEIGRRIVGSLVIDEHHMTDDQMLAKAREFYSHSETKPQASP